MWMSSRRRAGSAAGAAAVAAVLLCSPAHAATNESGEAAIWTPKELHFVYMGFSSRYSCDGLRDDVRSVLLKLGARSDVKVDAICAETSGVPTTLPGITVRMNVLQPASAAVADASENRQVIPAHWKTVELPDPARIGAGGDCELIEQIKQDILPLFATRNVEFRANCIPHEPNPAGVRLRAEVLTADQNDTDASARH